MPTFTLTVTYKLADTYTDYASIIDDASKDSCVTTSNSKRCYISMISLIKEYGMPTDILSVVTGFGTNTIEDRISVLQAAISQGHTPSEFLLPALKTDVKIAEYLFSVGASLYDKNGDLTRIEHQKDSTGTAFNQNINRFFDGHILLLRHVHSIRNDNDRQVIKDLVDPKYFDSAYGYRLKIITKNICKDAELQNMIVDIIRMCIDISPVETMKSPPECPHVIAKLLVNHGIAFVDKYINRETSHIISELHSQREKREAELVQTVETLVNKAEDIVTKAMSSRLGLAYSK